MNGNSSRQRVSSGSPYELRLGISRAVAVRTGRIIAVAGTNKLRAILIEHPSGAALIWLEDSPDSHCIALLAGGYCVMG